MPEPRLFKVDNEGHIALQWTTSGNVEASKKEGRPIFDKVLRGDVLAPGQGKSTPSFILVRISPDGREQRKEPYYSKYEPQITQFRASEDGGDLQGTAIDAWPMIDMQTAATFKAAKVFTVEQLADLPDVAKQHLGMMANEWMPKARNWLAAARDSATVGRLTSELGERDAKINDLQRQLSELVQRFSDVDLRTKEGRALKAAGVV